MYKLLYKYYKNVIEIWSKKKRYVLSFVIFFWFLVNKFMIVLCFYNFLFPLFSRVFGNGSSCIFLVNYQQIVKFCDFRNHSVFWKSCVESVRYHIFSHPSPSSPVLSSIIAQIPFVTTYFFVHVWNASVTIAYQQGNSRRTTT